MILDPNETPKDALQPEKTGQPSAEGKEASEELVEIFTKEDVTKAVSDALSTQGRELAELRRKAETGDLTAKELVTAKTMLAQFRKDQEEREYEEAKTDPDRLAVFRRKQAVAQKEATLAEREDKVQQQEAEQKELIEAGYKVKKIEAAHVIAKDYPGVEAKDLLDAGLETPEQMKVFAAALSKAKGAVRPPILPLDSGLGAGAGGKPSIEQLESMPMEQYAAYAKKRDEKK